VLEREALADSTESLAVIVAHAATLGGARAFLGEGMQRL
jgi:hypothetical protein